MSRVVVAMLLLAAAVWAEPIGNGGFETGDLTGWTDSGDTTTQVVDVLEAGDPFFPPSNTIDPTEGDWFAIVGTGPGDLGLDFDPDTGILSRTFTIAFGRTLSFDWNFVTEEFTGDEAFDIFDFFEVSLIKDGGPTTVLLSGDVGGDLDTTVLTNGGPVTTSSTMTFEFIDPIDEDFFGTEAPDGQVYLEQTLWASYKTFIAAPGTYTIEFFVSDDLDGFGDSALLIDNFNVPEPTSLGLLSVLTIIGVVVRRRRR